VDFDKNGKQLNQASVPQGTTDVFVISHGWNNDKAEASALYQELVSNIASELPGFDTAGRKFAIVGIFWPSVKFNFKIAAQGSEGAGPTAAARGSGSDPASEAEVSQRLLELQQYLSMDRLPETTAVSQPPDPEVEKKVASASALVPQLHQTTARDEFVAHIRSLVSNKAANEEDGSSAFFTIKKGDELMKKLLIDEDDLAEDLHPGGGATAISTGSTGTAQPTGGAASVVGFFKGFAGSALNLINYTTYYEMKTRAGTVGKNGVAPLVDELATGVPPRNIHLIGHSFGGRVVAAAAVDSKTDKIKSLTLLQAAFSHNGFSQKGFFRGVVENGRVHGPIVITYTKNDDAVGRAYPIASRLSGDTTAALGDKNDEYGGMGRNGAQKMTAKELDAKEVLLREADEAYTFGRRIFNLEADKFIKNHGDVRGKQVANAVLSAVAQKK
jgi:pimeloyl-ACP methyl ester carboxylesterase